MTTNSILGAVRRTALCLMLLTVPAWAQQRGGGGGGGFGGGGFGGGGGGGGGAAGRSGAVGRTYPNNGTIGDVYFTIDPDTHNVVVIGDEETLKNVGSVITNLDRPQPQVLIKVVFLEVTHADGLDLGFEGGVNKNISGGISGSGVNGFGLSGLSSATTNFNSYGIPFQSFAPTATGAGIYQVLGSDFQATLRAIATAGKTEVLSRPSVLARNNQPATIIVGQKVPLITSVRYDTLGNAINSVTYQDVGIILKVTPFIGSDGLVQMIVSPEISSISQTVSQPITTGVSAPAIDDKSADTVVVTPNGQTVIIGGLMEDSKATSESKVPLLGDIPWVGNLFKHKIKSNAKQELIIFLTPYVINAPDGLAEVSAHERQTMIPAKSISEEELDRFLDKPRAKPSKSR
jgi:type II secretion system protein D